MHWPSFLIGTAVASVVIVLGIAWLVSWALRFAEDDEMATPWGECVGTEHRQHIRTGRR